MISDNVETNNLSFQWIEHRQKPFVILKETTNKSRYFQFSQEGPSNRTISNFRINDQRLKMITFFRILEDHKEFTIKLLTINGNY